MIPPTSLPNGDITKRKSHLWGAHGHLYCQGTSHLCKVHMDASIVKVQVTHVWCTWTLLLSRYKSPMYGAHGHSYCQGTSHLCRMTLLCNDFGSPRPLIFGNDLILGLFSLVLHSKVSVAIGCMHWLPFCHMVEFNNSLM
jgi:hypothetical protein